MVGLDQSSVTTDPLLTSRASFSKERPLAKQSTLRVNKTKKVSIQRNKKSPLQHSRINKPLSKDAAGRPLQSSRFKYPKNSAGVVKLTPAFAQEAPADRSDALKRFKSTDRQLLMHHID